jgi:hypothetical protein
VASFIRLGRDEEEAGGFGGDHQRPKFSAKLAKATFSIEYLVLVCLPHLAKHLLVLGRRECQLFLIKGNREEYFDPRHNPQIPLRFIHIHP